MASKVYFEDNTLKVIDATESAIDAALLECTAEIVSATARNTRVDTGQLKNSWRGNVERTSTGFEAVMGSPLQNAIWEELGTGEYALEGNGRKDGWAYQDAKGDWHYTHGKKPSRAFWNAFTSLKSKIINHIQEVLKGM